MAYADQVPGSRRIATIAGVAIIHGAMGYALVTGMAVDVVRAISRTLTTTNVALPEKPPEPELPPPPASRALPQPSTPTTITVVEPIVATTGASEPVHVDLVPPITILPLPEPTVAVTPPRAESRAVGPRVRGAKGAWITTEDYPAASVRAEEEGVVGLSVRIGTDGRVTSCAVTSSSGSVALDAASCRLYQRRARFEPALDDAGNAVAAGYSDRVRWQLPQ